jgi:hypothetical protein
MSDADPPVGGLPSDLPTSSVPPLILTQNEILDEWLNTYYLRHEYHGNELSIQVKDFVTIPFQFGARGTRNWLEDDQLVVPLALAAEDQKRADILVVPPFPAQALARVGLGQSSREMFMETHSELYLQMMSDAVRWIVVPCTDAMFGDRVLTESTKNPTIETIQRGGKRTKTRRIGQAHWGFMIVDMTESRASWLDGHLTIRLRRDGYHIRHMYRAGWTAGKMLCGIDTVMERERGQFAATTLMHVPHDSHNNLFGVDRGSACAPWVFAMFRYILDHPDVLTEANGLNGAFAVARKAEHITNMAFHSQQTRLAMQRIIDDQVSDCIEKQA